MAGFATIGLPAAEPPKPSGALDERLAQPIWCDENGLGRNVFVHFHLAFALEQKPTDAWFHLFADTRYRLRVNGEIVSYGPAAFLVDYPEYDSIDLTPWLRVGDNEVSVEVNSRGDTSFQAEPSRGGFIAWGEARAADSTSLADFATPGKWRARRADAWSPEAPPFSFAQGPVEIVDLSRLRSDGRVVDPQAPGWQEPVVADRKAWGKVTPRSVPRPVFDLWIPQRIVTLAPLASPLTRVSANRSLPVSELPERGQRFACAMWLHASAATSTHLSVTPGDIWLNGRMLAQPLSPERPLEARFAVELRAGWNLVYGEFPPLARTLGIVVGWPREVTLRLASHPRSDAPENRIRFSSLMPSERLPSFRDSVPSSEADLERLGEFFDSGLVHTSFPSREIAWDQPVATTVDRPRDIAPLELPLSAAGEGMVVYDFGREFIGHVSLEIDAPAGGVMDVANEELLQTNGSVRMFRPNTGINPVDRVHLRPGLNRWEGFHARGGRYVQLSVRSNGPVTVRRVGLRNTLVPVPASGTFSCNDEVFNWSWDAGVATLEASLTDGWVDPWREQGLYIGDVLVEYLAHRIWTRDTTHIVRALRMWSQGQLPDGQLRAVVPAWFRRYHADYTLLWIVILRDYVTHTGDRAFAEELWPTVERIWSSATWRSGPRGLWTADGMNVFGDWGATEASIEGDANGILNAFRVGALQASAELAEVLGQSERAAAFRRERESVAAAFREVLWDAQRKAFAPCLRHGVFVDTPAAHANTLALLYRIASPEQEAGALAAVRSAIEKAAADPGRCHRRGGHIELYFLHYVLEMLADRGLHEDAENTIRRFWGLQREHGAWCLWEAFYRGLRKEDSQCHGWSAGPSVYFHRTVLGIETKPGRVTVIPRAASLTHARGIHPHPKGDIVVEWRIENQTFYLDVELPAGLAHDVRPGPTFAHLEPRVTIRTR
jgi:Glycogen debranching enzyme